MLLFSFGLYPLLSLSYPPTPFSIPQIPGLFEIEHVRTKANVMSSCSRERQTISTCSIIFDNAYSTKYLLYVVYIIIILFVTTRVSLIITMLNLFMVLLLLSLRSRTYIYRISLLARYPFLTEESLARLVHFAFSTRNKQLFEIITWARFATTVFFCLPL